MSASVPFAIPLPDVGITSELHPLIGPFISRFSLSISYSGTLLQFYVQGSYCLVRTKAVVLMLYKMAFWLAAKVVAFNMGILLLMLIYVIKVVQHLLSF